VKMQDLWLGEIVSDTERSLAARRMRTETLREKGYVKNLMDLRDWLWHQ
jgi:hypothetical protein